MNKLFLRLIALLFVLTGCHPADKKIMNIEGRISSKYDGQIMYLVPRPHPTPETVDSTYIKNGTFKFSIPADSAIYDIGISRRAEAYIQRLLIIAEEGTLHITMNTSSSGSGTPLNNQLQHWKELMEETGQKAMTLSREITQNKDNKVVVKTLEEEREHIYEAFSESTFCFIKQNVNPLGRYLFTNMKHILSEQQTAELKKLGIEQ